MYRPTLLSLVLAALVPFAAACGSEDSSMLESGIRGPSAAGLSSDAGGPVPGEPATLPDGAINPLYCPTGLSECSAACVDLTSDAKNCGACGAACGGACTASRCIVTLASGGGGTAIAVDGTSVYFAGQAGLQRVPIGGGAVATLASGANGAVAVDAKNAYYSTAQGVMSVPLVGGAPRKLGLYPANGITSNTKGVCWTAVNGDVVSVPVPDESDGGTMDGGASDGGDDAGLLPLDATTLAANQDYPAGLIADSTAVYWTTSGTLASGGGFAPRTGTVMRFAFSALAEDGGASDAGATAIATAQSYPFAITADATNVYWTASGTVGAGYADGEVMKAPVTGGTPTALASGQSFPYGIAADSANVYWANNANAAAGGTLMSVPIGGGAAVTLVSGVEGPTYVAVDATSVYWTTSAGAIMKATPK
jgi:hypothetical protein